MKQGKGGSHMKNIHDPRYKTSFVGFLWSVVVSKMGKEREDVFYFLLRLCKPYASNQKN